jgi:chromosomal replication initiation ATPase DnaA
VTRRIAARHYEVPLADITARSRRSRRASRARHVAIYLAHVALGLPLGAVAADFRRDRTTAEYACRVVEDARDDPAFDAALAGLELSAGVLIEFGAGEGAE